MAPAAFDRVAGPLSAFTAGGIMCAS